MHDIEKLYRQRHTQSVKTMARILGGDYHAGEDITQEAFCRAWKFYPSFDPERGELNTWFNAILFNALRDYQRTMKMNVSVPENDFSVEDVLDKEYLSNNPDKREHLQDLVNTVQNETHREVVYLFFVLGYTSSEISQIIAGMSTSNVTTIVMRFRKRYKMET